MRLISKMLSIFAVFSIAVFLLGCSDDDSSSAFPIIPRADELTDFEKDGEMELKVSIRALEAFSMIEQILEMFQQTGYADSHAINQGPYAAMVADEMEHGKQMSKWIINSKMVLEGYTEVNKVYVWIDDPGVLRKGVCKIYSAPTEGDIYGVWTMNLGFFDKDDGTRTGFIAASSTKNASGNTEVMLNLQEENEWLPEGEMWTVQGKLTLTNDEGSGIVYYTSENWTGEEPEITYPTAIYAYNDAEVALQVDDADPIYLDRESYADIFMEYNVYSAEGENIRKSKNFGKPVMYEDDEGDKHHMYYGGWQGRHQLWGPQNVTVPVGAELESVEYGEEETTYTLGARYMGYLVEKTLVTTSMNDIKGEVLETWVNEGFKLYWNGSEWRKCDGSEGPWDCSSQESAAYDQLSSLVSDEQEHKMVWIWSDEGELTYNASSPSSFVKSDSTNYTPSATDEVWVNINMPIFVTYTGSGWKRYMDVQYSENSWEPTLSDLQDYTFEFDGEFYMHSKGLNYILTVAGLSATGLKKELENVIQPGTEANALENVTFTSNGTDYYWDTTALMLCSDSGLNNVHTQSEWYMEGDNSKVYTWQYAMNENETWNIMTYLKDADGEFVYLDDPIFFATINGVDMNGDIVEINGAAYDGHLFGVADVWMMMNENDGVLSGDMKDKIINIPEGDITGRDGNTYKIKPIFGVRLLDIVSQSDTSPTIDSSLTLDDLPEYEDISVGDMPEIETISFVEGEYVGE
ncbi:MAG: hypothetical protein SVZ03_11580 [Spirochaetota bacterium]|nr:hypothetical protein [Spirochaetota bacterium]